MSKAGLFDGPDVTLPEILKAREDRVARRSKAQSDERLPALTLTIVMPGRVKDCPLSRQLADAARAAIDLVIRDNAWDARLIWSGGDATGPETLYLVDTTPENLKRAMVNLEENHPLGRLWDLDVHSEKGEGLSRKQFGLPRRRCLVCGQEAHACARSRAHSLSELLEAMEAMVLRWRDEETK
ncbi:citrate lyase holo-[acyl-carrier protein] synthase [uncultured Cohaesibacter sp.]|uniref:citrate lyase holo-[acyl-carrier protein] synthase n=1 Tax=uncultured Cohaesibacter sp. TaxID=1002546 RepID=UPI0029C7E824|nr:citrate lyase holo-[acyl-carrier protein] synthase [uncultured Cohaesibacter sp.]